MNFDEIIYDKKDRVATVTMNRPEKMNAWTPKMGAEMRTAMMDAERDSEIGAIIVTGAINGACVGLGFTTCLYQDIRIASENARMGLIFVQRGLAIEHGSSWMLPRIIGLARATELAITGRLVDANEAHEIGLVTRVVPQDKLMATAH